MDISVFLVPSVMFLIIISGCACHKESSYTIANLGKMANMNCSQREEDIVVIHWLLPHHLQIVEPGYTEEHYQLSPNGEHLHIHNIGMDQIGDYYCYYYGKGSNRSHYTKHIVHLYVPSILEEYRMNLMVGGISAGVFLVVSTLLCVIYSFMWENKHSDNQDQVATILTINSNYLNVNHNDFSQGPQYAEIKGVEKQEKEIADTKTTVYSIGTTAM